MYLQSNNIFTPTAVEAITKSLNVGIYEVCFNPDSGFYLERQRDGFTFPEKLYDIDNRFIDRCVNTFIKGNTNMGVLMNGFKGTGKTINSKIIATKVNLPILLINQSFHNLNENMVSFLSKITQDCVIILDEFEKNFKEDDSFILKLMDGLYNSEHKKLFILTTNRTRINENLINRPSRIRYSRNYSNLSYEMIKQVLNDNLDSKYKNIENEIIDFIVSLDLITIDIMKIVVDEINKYGFNIKDLINYVNIKQSCISTIYFTIRAYATQDGKTFYKSDEITANSLTDEVRNILIDLKKKANISENAIYVNTSELNKLVSDFNENNKKYYLELEQKDLTTSIEQLSIGSPISEGSYTYKKSEVDQDGIFLIEDYVLQYAIVISEIRETIYNKVL